MSVPASVLQVGGSPDAWILLGFVSVYALLAVVLAWFAADGDDRRRPPRCPNCGRSHDPTYRYCGHCAARVAPRH